MTETIKKMIRTIPDFPKKGIMFRDVTTLLKDPVGLKEIIDLFVKKYSDKEIDYVAGIESRGFIIGGILARDLGVGFIPIRKKGKLPGKVITQEYELEYGTDILEIHEDALEKGDKVLLVDDLIATGGSCKAACDLIEKVGGEIVECAFIVDLPDLKGKEKLAPRNAYCLVEFEGE
jgi:adenine phosphoribosyltransferase